MNKGEEKKIHEILESGSIGYAYLFDAKARKTLEKVVSLEPENLAALFRKYGTEMEWMSVTDMRDMIIPGISEPPARTLRATVPENERHIFR